MSQNDCCICFVSLNEAGGPVRLLCGHTRFHLKCIKKLYRTNKNKFTEFFEPLYPECPLCRYRFRARDLPGYRGPREASIGVLTPLQRSMIAQPAHASMPSGSRPVRLSRTLQVVERTGVQTALDRLIAQREALLRRAAENNPVRLENPPPPPRRPIELIEISSSSSASSKHSAIKFNSPSPPQFRAFSQEDPLRPPTPNYSTPLPPSPVPSRRPSTDTQRSRSPLSPAASQNVALASQPESNPVRLELQDVNMQIGIMRGQLERIAEQSEPCSAPIDHDADDSGEEEEEEEADLKEDQPVTIEGHHGKGRNISYMVRWSSGRVTVNRCREVEQICMPLLKLYRAFLNRKHVANHRNRKK